MLLIGILVSGVTAYLGYTGMQPIRHLNQMFFDACQSISASEESVTQTIVVDIDDNSLQVLGQWPWPRYRVATLIQALADMHPAVIGLDIMFTEQDRSALTNIRKRFKQDFNLDIKFSGVPLSLTDNDGYLGSVLAEAPVVGAEYFHFEHESKVEILPPPSFQISGRTELLDLHDAAGLLTNTYKIASQLKYKGFINSRPDDDGILRKLPLLIQYNGGIYPHLALATYMRSLGENTASIQPGRYGPAIRIGNKHIPITVRGFALLRFNGGSHLYPSVSALDILNGKVNRERFRDKTIYIGSSAAGLKDLHHTVFDPQFPGVKTLAVATSNFTEGNIIIEPVWARKAESAVTLMAGLAITLLFVWMRNILLVMAYSILTGTAILAGSVSAFAYASVTLSPAPAISTLLVLFMLLFILRFTLEKRQSYFWFHQLSQARQALLETLDETEITRILSSTARTLLACESTMMIYFSGGEAKNFSSGHRGETADVDFLPEHILQMQQPYISNDVANDKHFSTEINQTPGFSKFIHMPIFNSDNRLLGCFEIFDRLNGSDFDELDIELLESLSGIASAALVNARLLAEQRQNKQVISEAAERLNRILDANFDAVIAYQNFKVVYTNKAAQQLFGYQPLEQTLGKNPLDYLPEPYRKKARRDINAAIRKNMSFGAIEMEGLRAESGETFPIEIASTPILWNTESAMVSIVRDITERKAREEELRLLASVVASVAESVFITDASGVIVYVNPSFSRNTGYSTEEALGQTPRILNSAFYEAMWKTISSGNAWHGKVINTRKDGSVFPAMLSIAPIVDDESVTTHFVGSYSDISELEAMEKQFHQAQKMEAIGTLVGGIAHDFNNMLAGMTGNLYLAKQRTSEMPEVSQKLANIENLSFRAADMIQQLLTFARKSMVSVKPIPLTPFIKETLNLLRSSVPENIKIHQHICSDPLKINGDSTQLHQVLMNLVSNARDAVEGVDDPCITVKLEAFQPDDVFVKGHAYFKSGSYAHLSVQDNGCGIPEHQIEHLFEPFFTTKEQGKGTGLGLAMVFGAIKTHQGFVEVESVEDEGATFHIYLPLLESEEDTCASLQGESIVGGHGEMILLVDDEQHIIETGKEVLESLGYQVITATDGQKAVELFEARSEEIDLCIFDIVMPVMGGDQAAKNIRQINQEMKIIFTTGYDKNLLADMVHEAVLSKPFAVEEMSHLIREQLDC